jgi:hypothetical protein
MFKVPFFEIASQFLSCLFVAMHPQDFWKIVSFIDTLPRVKDGCVDDEEPGWF